MKFVANNGGPEDRKYQQLLEPWGLLISYFNVGQVIRFLPADGLSGG